MECLSLLPSTKRLTVAPFPSVLVSVGSEWQERQSASLSFGAACAVDAQVRRKKTSGTMKKLRAAFTI
jgi:hypothetical protein